VDGRAAQAHLFRNERERGRVEQNQGPEPGQDGEEGFPLIDARLLGWLLFPYAVAEIQRVPPANDPDVPEPSGGAG
jgi:hypothetical protein